MRTRLRAVAGEETGAALVFALIIVTVIALVAAGVLTLGDTGMRSTVAMRERASISYAGDAAAEVALNQLRRDNFNGSSTGCDSSTTEVLSNFYPATATAPGASAAVTCTPDQNASLYSPANSSPGTALLALAVGSEVGIQLDSESNASFKVRGSIYSNSSINFVGTKSKLENVAANSYAYAINGCTPSLRLIVAAGTDKDCVHIPAANENRGKDPGTVAGHGLSFNAPTVSGSAQTPPGCGTPAQGPYHLPPGLYTSAAALNTLLGCGGGSVIHLTPGTYVFDFPSSEPVWDISKGFLVGGTTVGPLTTSPTLPGSCVNPGSAAATTSSGVKLVFGGLSQLRLSNAGSIELCASNSASGPPMVVYGLKTAVGTVPAQSGCVTQPGYGAIADAAHCAVLSTDQSPNSSITLWGTTYIPKAAIDLSLNNSSQQVFRWGLHARVIRIQSTGSPSLTNPVIDVPDDATAPFALPAQRYLDVYVCPGSATCSAATPWKHRLRASVIVGAAAEKTITVTSWATIR